MDGFKGQFVTIDCDELFCLLLFHSERYYKFNMFLAINQIKNVVTYILIAIVLSKISFSLTFILLLGK